jgi:DNA-directed RNA polymerase subunit RPC12/RpoP
MESLLFPVMVVYRCMKCSLRQLKLRLIEVGPHRVQEKARFQAN